MLIQTLVSTVALALMLLSSVATADYVVFVHGFIGFGPDELLGVGYWGFSKIFGSHQDYISKMRQRGHKVLYASVGPLSSNWDRACELYAQIKGTRVDYGKAHSQKYNHARFGTDYTGKGFYPQWDGSHKIHLVGHSMGGNTMRMLEYLLQKGSAEEEAMGGQDLSLLFRRDKPSGNNWIQSMHTIAAPHDGTTSMLLGESFLSFSKQTLLAYGAVAGLESLNVDWLYDFDLTQFGLDRKRGESFASYFDRVFDSAVLRDDFIDNAMYDLGPDACKAFNNLTELTYPGTYYFSYSTSQTHGCGWDGDHCPDFDIEIFLAPTAYIMGHIGGHACLRDGYCFSKVEWSENDGVVPRRSSRGPELGVRNYVPARNHPTKCSLFKCEFDNSALLPGIWYTRHVHRDHTQVVGLRFNLLELDASGGVYTNVADTIQALRLSPSSVADEPILEENLPTSESTSSNTVGAEVIAPVSVGLLMAGVIGMVAIRRRRQSMSKTSEEEEKRNSVVSFKSSQSSNPQFLVHNDDGVSAAA